MRVQYRLSNNLFLLTIPKMDSYDFGRLEPLKTEAKRILRQRKAGTSNGIIFSSSGSNPETNSDRSGGSLSIPLPCLHESLMRTRTETDPYRYYEIVKVLGEGSMGNVTKVHKRKSMLGGSARSEFVKQEKQRSRLWCFDFKFSCFQFCSRSTEEETKDSLLETIEENAPSQDMSTSLLPASSNNQNIRTGSESSQVSSSSSIITYGRKDVPYALKSIHVDRVRDTVYRMELMNEIVILQTLDHPNIVKAIVSKPNFCLNIVFSKSHSGSLPFQKGNL